MKIQLDIPKELNKNLKIEKVKREFKNLQETILFILNNFQYSVKEN